MTWSLNITGSEAHEVLGKWILNNGLALVADLQKSQGSRLVDARSGDTFLDLFGFFASRPLGFNHPKLQSEGFAEHLAAVARHKPSNCDVYTREYAAFIDRFGTVALENEFRHVFVIEGGSPAVENAIKAAMDWKHRKNIAAGRGEKGTQIVHFRRCFHGRTGYSLSMTDSYDPRKTQWFPKFPWPRIDNPHIRYPVGTESEAALAEREQAALAQIHQALDENADDIAAILIEPTQGEGGDNYFRSEFLQGLRDIADEREVMLIFDEVQTGFGSPGRWWDWQVHGVKPDLMVFGKKTQVCGFASTDRIDEVDGVFKTGSRISSTFEGNIVDMLRCIRVMEIVEEDALLDNAEKMGARLLAGVADLEAKYDEVQGARGRGLWTAFDLPSPEMRKQVLEQCFKDRLILIASGERSIRFRPSLDIDPEVIDQGLEVLDASLGKVLT